LGRVHLVGLEWERLSIQERIETDFRLGRHRELIGELSTLAAQHPTQGTWQAPLMLALYRSDRRTQALEVVQRLRRVLNDELCPEPSPRVWQLQRAILSGRCWRGRTR